LKTIYKEAVFVEEINPYFFVKNHLGGALTDKNKIYFYTLEV